MFTHLQVHSAYSFLRGVTPAKELVRAAAQDGMTSLALTDYHSLSGAVEFYDACREIDIKPILGLEVSVTAPSDLGIASDGVLTLLAMDQVGWRSLCRLASCIGGEGKSLPFETMAKESEGLICLGGGQRGMVAQLVVGDHELRAKRLLGMLKDIYTDRLYVSLNWHSTKEGMVIERLINMARDLSLKAVAVHDIHYLRPEQDHIQRVLAAIRQNTTIKDVSDTEVAPPDAYFLSREAMTVRFADFPDALANTIEVAERCQCKLPLGEAHYPDIFVDLGMSALDVLRRKAEEGARRLYGSLTPEVNARLEHELAVIDECGYAALFLIVEDILSYARRNGVPLSSRGSAASSLVAHCLGITSPDPLRLNLYFERFLNPARATPPDIDTDLCSRRREKVIRYVYERFGQERVATVCTINCFRSRSALREVAKAYGMPAEEISELTEALPQRWYGPRVSDVDPGNAYEELGRKFPQPLHRSIMEDARALIGLPHHLSVHPGGIVIAPGELTDLVPTQMAAKGVIITQFDLGSVERMGLVKIDLLGIRGLTVLGDVAEAVVVARGRPSSASIDFLDGIPEDDPVTRDAVMHGRTIGCFAIESPGMRATLCEIKAQSVDDIMIGLALYRPGPLSGGLKDAFVRRHCGLEQPNHLHPSLGPLLKDTYGVILYQEQVLRIANELAGLSLAEADLLRRAMSHFDPGQQMQTLKEKFIAGALGKSGVPEAVGLRVWELMAAFAGYGFPKAHAASYAQIAWRAVWCKVHYPELLMAAVLANWGGYYSQRVYLMEARRLGLTIQAPHVNYSQREFSVQYLDEMPVLFMGLDQVQDLTRRTQAAILRERPFHSLIDFLARTDPRPQEADNLARSGALDGFGTIPELLYSISLGGWRGGQLSMFQAEVRGEDWELPEKVAAQEEVLGISVIAHPLELVEQKIANANALNTLEATERVGQRVRVAGMRQTWRRSQTSRGESIYFMALEDVEGILNVVIDSDVYRRCRTALKGSGPYIVEGVVELDTRQGDVFLRTDKVWNIR
ncbi:MAG: DNA polymerase III subunit alpha [Anaerolineales bacterium]|nr:DNA polymerase III subunit alpha [Anaerolineales bacterium]